MRCRWSSSGICTGRPTLASGVRVWMTGTGRGQGGRGDAKAGTGIGIGSTPRTCPRRRGCRPLRRRILLILLIHRIPRSTSTRRTHRRRSTYICNSNSSARLSSTLCIRANPNTRRCKRRTRTPRLPGRLEMYSRSRSRSRSPSAAAAAEEEV